MSLPRSKDTVDATERWMECLLNKHSTKIAEFVHSALSLVPVPVLKQFVPFEALGRLAITVRDSDKDLKLPLFLL